MEFHDDDEFKDLHPFEKYIGNDWVFEHCGKTWKVSTQCPPCWLCPICEEAIVGRSIRLEENRRLNE